MDHLKSSSPSPPLGMYKKNCRPSAPKNREGTNHSVNGSIAIGKGDASMQLLFQIQLPRAWAIHYNIVWVFTRSLYNPLTASMAWLSLSCWTLSKQETIGASPALDMDAGRAINTRCLLCSKLTFGSCPCLYWLCNIPSVESEGPQNSKSRKIGEGNNHKMF